MAHSPQRTSHLLLSGPIHIKGMFVLFAWRCTERKVPNTHTGRAVTLQRPRPGQASMLCSSDSFSDYYCYISHQGEWSVRPSPPHTHTETQNTLDPSRQSGGVFHQNRVKGLRSEWKRAGSADRTHTGRLIGCAM